MRQVNLLTVRKFSERWRKSFSGLNVCKYEITGNFWKNICAVFNTQIYTATKSLWKIWLRTFQNLHFHKPSLFYHGTIEWTHFQDNTKHGIPRFIFSINSCVVWLRSTFLNTICLMFRCSKDLISRTVSTTPSPLDIFTTVTVPFTQI